MVKLEQVGQLVKQDGAGFGHDDLLYSNLRQNISNKLICFKAEKFPDKTSVSFTLSGLQTPSVMWPTTSCKLSSTPEARRHSNIRDTVTPMEGWEQKCFRIWYKTTSPTVPRLQALKKAPQNHQANNLYHHNVHVLFNRKGRALVFSFKWQVQCHMEHTPPAATQQVFNEWRDRKLQQEQNTSVLE